MKLDDFYNKLMNLKKLKVAVIGDYCLDQYMYTDSANDKSHDYNKTKSFLISRTESYPGGAGNVAKNFTSLGVKVSCLGIIGNDGNGYELKKQLVKIGADINYMIAADEKITNSCLRPIRFENKQTIELNEMLTENYTQTSEYLTDKIISNLEKAVKEVDAMVFVEQFDEGKFGIFNKRVKEKIAQLAGENKKVIFLADSRKYINNYSNIYLKCNQNEFENTFFYNVKNINRMNITHLSNIMNSLNNLKAFFITTGKDGMKVYNKEDQSVDNICAIKVGNNINTCGAGDSATVGIVIGLCLGYNIYQSAFLGNIISSITIQDLDSTGRATVNDVIKTMSKSEQNRLISAL